MDGPPSSLFGTSVAISHDGSFVAVGGQGYDGVRGLVRLYGLAENNSWLQFGHDIVGEAPGDVSGYAISLATGNGLTVAISAYQNDGESGTESGHVRIYQLDTSKVPLVWRQRRGDIDGEAASDWSGSAVSLSGDGRIVAIGALQNRANGENAGHVSVYEFRQDSWIQMGSDIDGVENSSFGQSAALSFDGRTVVVGAPWDLLNKGSVHVYEFNTATKEWERLGNAIVGDEFNSFLGISVDISRSGRTVAIGASTSDRSGAKNSGRASVFQLNDARTEWLQVGDELLGRTEEDQFGNFVSLSGDGTVVAIGAPGENPSFVSAGYAAVYTIEASCVENSQTVAPSPTDPPTNATLPPERQSASKNLSTGVLVGIILGGAVLVAGGMVALAICHARTKTKRDRSVNVPAPDEQGHHSQRERHNEPIISAHAELISPPRPEDLSFKDQTRGFGRHAPDTEKTKPPLVGAAVLQQDRNTSNPRHKNSSRGIDP